MRIRCDHTALISSLSVVGRALSARTSMPVLEGVYMEAQENGIKFICTDLQKGIETWMTAEVLEEGAAVLPGRLFIEIIRKLPGGEVEIQGGESEVSIWCGDSHTALQIMDARDFPQLPDIASVHPILMDQGTLRDMIAQTCFAAAVDESRLILTGVLFELDGDLCRMVALDGFRLSLRQANLGADYGALSAVVPSASLGEIGKIMEAGGEEKARITLTDSHLFIHVGPTKFVTRLLEGEFIRYRQILPSDWQTRILVDVRQMAQAVDRASTLAREGRNNPIRFSIAGSQLQIRSNNEQGNNLEIVPVQLEGKEIEIAFNARYLTDVFKVLDAQEVYLCFTTNVSPCVIRPAEGEDFLYLVLPVRVYTQ